MNQPIVGFEQDELGDWRAILACGHRQHVRDNPPLVSRPRRKDCRPALP